MPELSKQSVERRLNSVGIYSHIAAVKDILTEEHRAARLHFALEYVNYPIEFWRWVLFTDEKCWSSAAHGQIRVHRMANERYSRNNIHSVKNSGRVSVTIWAAMWLGGLSPIYRVQGNLTAVQYVNNVLENTLVPYANAFFPQNEPVHFVQDK